MKTATHCELKELPRSQLWALQNEEYIKDAKLTRIFVWLYVLVSIAVIVGSIGYAFQSMYEHNQKLEKMLKNINTPLCHGRRVV